MVDISLELGVFKDAADAADKLVDTVRKIGRLFEDAISEGSDLVAWSEARNLRIRLSEIHAETAELWVSQIVDVKDTLADYIDDPSPEEWGLFERAVGRTVVTIHSIQEKLKSDSRELSDLPIYAQLLATLGEREHVLRRELEVKEPPTSGVAFAQLKNLLEKYIVLIDELGKYNTQIEQYIVGLKSGGKWPIKSA
jgi:hypothetical protein